MSDERDVKNGELADRTDPFAEGELATAFNHLRELVGAVTRVVRDVQPELSAAAKALTDAASKFKEWEQRAPDALASAVKNAGLIVPLSQMALADVVEVTDLHREDGSEAAVERLRRCYDDIFADASLLPRLHARWRTHRWLARRYSVPGQALTAHEQRLYAVSTPALIAQFEGLIADAAQHLGRMSGADLRRHVSAFAASDPVAGPMCELFITDVLLHGFGHGQVIPPFSRHAILHGGDVTYGTESNSRAAIMLVDLLAELTE